MRSLSLPRFLKYRSEGRLRYPAEWANRVPQSMTYKHACHVCVAGLLHKNSRGQDSVLCDVYDRECSVMATGK